MKGRVRHGALTDPMTELPNRLHFDVVYRIIWEAGGRGIPVTLIRFEIVGFEGASEEGQRRVGERLNATTRHMDMIARLDHEQFGLLLMDCNAFGAMVAAERCYGALGPILDEYRFPFHAGIAPWRETMSRPDDLMTSAEQALAIARTIGPGRIEVHQSAP